MAQINAIRDDLEVVEVRGNVDTRLRKLADGEVDALVLALAGLQRLGREREAGGVLVELVPAAGQGALAVEARAGEIDGATLSDATSMACVTAERELVQALGASCNTPVGAYATSLPSGRVELTGWAGLPDGSAWVRDTVSAVATGAGALCAERMLAAGAGEILRDAAALR